MKLARLLLILGWTIAVVCAARGAWAAGPVKRIAVVIGANEPPSGRQRLRFAYDDAKELADVLRRAGGFAPADVHVLLDPHPAEILAALDDVAQTVAAAGGNALVVFYYSGHSDGQSLFPHGEAIGLSTLRARVEHLGARILVGILDTCHGGSWTQSKGLTLGPPLADLFNVDTEGTALISSSSGLENAHEADAVHGSFFTHHLVAGLRGAADTSHDGNVTLQEAFVYARERTVRDSARIATTPQHPSFDLALRGRQDVVLTSIASSTSALEVTARGSLEVIHLVSGVTVAEAPDGAPGPLRLAVPPGRYLVRSVAGGHVLTKEVEVHAGQTLVVSEGELEAAGDGKLANKGTHAPLDIWGPRGRKRWLLRMSAGVGGDASTATIVGQVPTTVTATSFSVDATLWYRITERLSWSVPWPALSYRFGERGTFEVMPYVGLGLSGWSSTNGVEGGARAEVAMRIWTTRSQFVSLRGGLGAPPYHDPDSPLGHVGFGHQLDPFASVGYAWTIKGLVTLGADVAMDWDYWLPLDGPASWQYQAEWLRLGTTVNVRMARDVSLELRTAWSTSLHGGLGSYPGFFLGPTVAF
jgi:hypothetical protein